jgi:hypothetical protein
MKELQAAVDDLREHCTRVAAKLNIELLPPDTIQSAMTKAKKGNITESAEIFVSGISAFRQQKALKDSENSDQGKMIATTKKIMSNLYPVAMVLFRFAGFVGNVTTFQNLADSANQTIDYKPLTIAVNAVQTTSEVVFF